MDALESNDSIMECFEKLMVELEAKEKHLKSIQESVIKGSENLDLRRQSTEAALRLLMKQVHLALEKGLRNWDLKEKEIQLTLEKLEKQRKLIAEEWMNIEEFQQYLIQRGKTLGFREEALDAKEKELVEREKLVDEYLQDYYLGDYPPPRGNGNLEEEEAGNLRYRDSEPWEEEEEDWNLEDGLSKEELRRQRRRQTKIEKVGDANNDSTIIDRGDKDGNVECKDCNLECLSEDDPTNGELRRHRKQRQRQKACDANNDSTIIDRGDKDGNVEYKDGNLECLPENGPTNRELRRRRKQRQRQRQRKKARDANNDSTIIDGGDKDSYLECLPENGPTNRELRRRRKQRQRQRQRNKARDANNDSTIIDRGDKDGNVEYKDGNLECLLENGPTNRELRQRRKQRERQRQRKKARDANNDSTIIDGGDKDSYLECLPKNGPTYRELRRRRKQRQRQHS